MKVVYIAGPYRSDSHIGILENIDRAGVAAREVWGAGCAAICPHTNSGHFGGVCPEEAFLEGYNEIVSRCDAVLVVGDYASSEGTMEEICTASSLGIPVFYSIEELREWAISIDDYPEYVPDRIPLVDLDSL